MSWWFLATVHDSSSLSFPRAFGPYPSREFCRLAGRQVAWRDRRFWTADEIAEENRRLHIELDDDGKEQWMSNYTTGFIIGPLVHAITGPVEILDEPRPALQGGAE